MRICLFLPTTLFALGWLLTGRPAEAQTEMQHHYFETSDGVDLHYLEVGSGRLLVFVPGWTMPAWIWQPQIDRFAASNHVIVLDPRGHGSSEKATYGYNADRQSKDVCELLKHLGDEPAVIVGWSIGGQHVLMCGDQVGPDVVRAVVVVDWDIDFAPSRDFAADRIARLQADRGAFSRAFVEAIHVQPDSAYAEALTNAVLEVPTVAAAMIIASWFFFGPHDMSPMLNRLNRPILLVFSGLDWSIEAAEEVRSGWPDLPVEVIEGTSHALFVDRPDAFNDILEKFLSSLPD